MRVVLFGATGMIGAGTLRECLLDPRVTSVLAIVRRSSGTSHPKLQEIIHADFFNYGAIQSHFASIDACLFCLGVSSAGMDEPSYRRMTFDLTLAAAQSMVAVSPGMTFCYISGAGADSTEKGSIMWARVKGMIENALLRLPFKAAYMFRPGFIQPLHGIRSKTSWYQAFYTVLGPLYPLLRRLPRYVTTTEALGRALIEVAVNGYSRPVLESVDINRVAAKTYERT